MCCHDVESRQLEARLLFIFISILDYLPFCHIYDATSLKTKELTNQQIKDALTANNCTSVKFDEVKRITNTDQHDCNT